MNAGWKIQQESLTLQHKKQGFSCMMKKLIAIVIGMTTTLAAAAVDLKKCSIVTSETDAPLVQKMATVMSEDIGRVTGVKPTTTHHASQGATVILATVEHAAELVPDISVSQLRGAWERYSITTHKTETRYFGTVFQRKSVKNNRR